uniref:YEATS domain-containing protein n=1 Tax=Ciona savignyi TaxID=51511 RepID=H2Z8N1_CIOSA
MKHDKPDKLEQNIDVPDPVVPALLHEMVAEQVVRHNVKDLIDDALPIVASLVPIVSEQRKLSEVPFCALTENEFRSWNAGKQRASQWQRATLVRQVLLRVKEILKLTENPPSKKFIVDWCLRHGFSVIITGTPGPKRPKPATSIVPTLSPMDLPCLNDPTSKIARNDSDTEVIDVVTSPSHTIPRVIDLSEETSPGLVVDIARQNGVRLSSYATQIVVEKAFHLFAEELLRASTAASMSRDVER